MLQQATRGFGQGILHCIGCRHSADLLSERSFRCPSCGKLYQIQHDFSGVERARVESLKRIFDWRATPRIGDRAVENRSGVWRFRELIMPGVADEHIVSLGEGLVPILPAGERLRSWVGGDLDIWIILEGLGPTGSFKDFGGTVMMTTAKAAGINAVGCASTGDTSAMSAAYSAAAGIACFVLLPEGEITDVQLMQPAAHGAHVIQLPGPFDEGMRVLQELVAEHNVYPANSLNPTRIEGHQATVFLTAQALGWKLPDWFAVPVGNGSNSSSIGKGMRLLVQLGFVEQPSRILGCQTAAANPLSASWDASRGSNDPLSAWRDAYRDVPVGKTVATAARIGSPVSREKVMREITASNGAMETADEDTLNEATLVCASDGILVCPQTGIALDGLRKAVAKGIVKSRSRVVVVSTATGLKFPNVFEPKVAGRIEHAPDCDTRTIARMLGI